LAIIHSVAAWSSPVLVLISGITSVLATSILYFCRSRYWVGARPAPDTCAVAPSAFTFCR
jgi:hypothetical protein